MKLHNHMKTGRKIRRCLSVLLVLCILFTSGSPNLASAADTEGHRHDESCYEDRLVCEKEEHTADCYEERQTLICMNQGEDGHVHDDGCYETERVLVCDLEEHVSERYERVLVCGKADGNMVSDTAAPVGRPDMETDVSMESSAGEADSALEEDSGSEGDSGAEEGSGQAPEENPEPEEKPGQAPEEDSGMDSDDGSELPGPSEGADANQPPETDEWKLICDKEHAHTEDCYQQLYCGMIEHTHTGECYDENDAAICEMEEHEHADLCLLPIEDQQKI